MEKQTFETFLPGPGGSLAMELAKAVAAAPGAQRHNPSFLHGPTGVGKTHLLRAIGAKIGEMHPGKRVKYLVCDDFIAELIQALVRKETEKFYKQYWNVDVLLLDDIQYLAGKPSTQEEFLRVMEHLVTAGKQVVATACRQPGEIPQLETRIAGRLFGGVVAEMTYPDLEARRQIAKQEAAHMGLEVEADALEEMALRLENASQIRAAVKRTAASVDLWNMAPTRPNVSKILDEIYGAPEEEDEA